MPASWQTVRVFISSTFLDMHAERDYLVRFVFPKLREELLQRRIHFVDMDLRWGVATEGALEVCREIVNECRPRFVCMLGGRYGEAKPDSGISLTHEEVNYAVLDRLGQHGYAFFYFRDPAATASIIEKHPGEFREPPGSENKGKLDALKKRIEDAGLNPAIYPARWDNDQRRLTDLVALGDQVYRDLLDSVKSDPGLRDRFAGEAAPQADEFSEENDAMDAFIAERTERYVIGSREPLLREMTAFATADGAPNIFVLTGDPGSGKSALLAKLAQHLAESAIGDPQSAILLLPHFIGASAGSTDLRRTLRRLCHELARAADNTEPLLFDIKELITHFQKLLAEASGRQRVILVFDALNQFDATDGAHWMNWLPRELPPGVRIVASVIAPADGQPEHQTLAILRTRPGTRMEKLEPLTEADTLAVIEGCLRRYAKRLSPEQLAALLAKPAGRLPLYVLTALEELRTLGTYEEITARIRTLPGDARALFSWILTERLARDPGFCDRKGRPCGAALVEKFAACLGVSRHGLSPAELAALLDPGDPLGNVAALLRLLRPYLMHRGELLDFYHGQFREAAEAAWVKTDPQRHATHQHLADYFVGCAKGTDVEKRWETNSIRGFAECVFHLIKAWHHDEAASLLSSFSFLLHKTRVGLFEAVSEDYDLLRHEAAAEQVRTVETWCTFFREKAHILRRGNDEWPPHKILLQLAVEHADDSPLTIAAENWLKANRCDWLWLRRTPRVAHVQKNPCLAVLEGHTDSVWGALELAGGRLLSRSSDNTLRLWDGLRGTCLAVLNAHTDSIIGPELLVLDDGRLLSWSSRDRALGLWDGQSGVCLALLEGHRAEVRGVQVLADGRLLSWSNDNTLRLWDGQCRECLAVLEGHTSSVNGVKVLADGRLLSWSNDETLRLWDGQSGACLATLRGHGEDIHGALELADGRLLSWSKSGNDTTLRLWDDQTGECLVALEGHEYGVSGALELADGRLFSWSRELRLWDSKSGACLAIFESALHVRDMQSLPNGRLLSMGDFDNNLRLWDGQSGTCLAVLEGHAAEVRGAQALADGRLLSWSEDKTLRLWDGQSGACLAVLEGHAAEVRGAQALADGRLLSWSEDHTLRLWDGQSGTCLAVLEGHTSSVYGVKELADGRLLSWSEDHTLRLWDGQSEARLSRPYSHSHKVKGALALSDGWLLSWSGGLSFEDDTLRMWDGHSGACVTVFKGHTKYIGGALELSDGRLLSWSGDDTLRLWHRVSGACLGVLEGHHAHVIGALELADGRLLSWAADFTLKLWDGQSGACLATLRGHEADIQGALELADGRLLSWAGFDFSGVDLSYVPYVPSDYTMRLWDGHSGVCLEVVSQYEVPVRRPEWLRLREKAQNTPTRLGGFVFGASARVAHLRYEATQMIACAWNAESEAGALCLLPGGTAVITQANGLCVLKLYHGNRRISLAKAEALIASQRKKTE